VLCMKLLAYFQEKIWFYDTVSCLGSNWKQMMTKRYVIRQLNNVKYKYRVRKSLSTPMQKWIL
jgi:hypothetical protein